MENFVVPKQESLQIYQKEQMSVKKSLRFCRMRRSMMFPAAAVALAGRVMEQASGIPRVPESAIASARMDVVFLF